MQRWERLTDSIIVTARILSANGLSYEHNINLLALWRLSYRKEHRRRAPASFASGQYLLLGSRQVG